MEEKINSWVNRIDEISNYALTNFSDFDNNQWNFRPASGNWSAGEVLDHLITTNDRYLEQIDEIIRNPDKKPWVSLIPGFSDFFGKRLINILKEKNGKKYKAIKKFRPHPDEFSNRVLNTFVSHQNELRDFIKKVEPEMVNTLVIPSPISSLIPIRLTDAFEALVLHEGRHMRQIDRLVSHPLFPQLKMSS